MLTPIETETLTLVPQWLVAVQAPHEDMERIAAAVTAITPLTLGKYDCNTFETAAGLERYRPLQGAAAGAETELRRRPGVSVLSFQLPQDEALLHRVADAVFHVHSYQEPVITVTAILASRTKGVDDSANPHRWWNTTGDWKKSAGNG